MGQKQSNRRKEPSHSTTEVRSVRTLYPNLANEVSAYGLPNTVDFHNGTSEACVGNTIPFHNVQSYYYNPVPSAPPAPPELLRPEITANAQRSIKQEDGKQTRDPEPWRNQEARGTYPEKKPCPNAGDGCKLHFTQEQMKQHVKECLFMDVTCPLDGVFGKCAWRDKVKHIKTHFSDVHPAHIGEVNQDVTLDSLRIINLVDLNPHKFLIQIKVDNDSEKILLSVQHYSTQICASKWTYEFEFHGPMMANSKLEGSCITAGVSITQKFKKLQCRVLTMSPCVTNAFRNGALRYKYRIMRKGISEVSKKIEETTSKPTTMPVERKAYVVPIPNQSKQPMKTKRHKKSSKTPLECLLTKH